jgi:uncharacterized protein
MRAGERTPARPRPQAISRAGLRRAGVTSRSAQHTHADTVALALRRSDGGENRMTRARHCAIVAIVIVSLRQQMQTDLFAAIKKRDAARVSVLRTTLAAIANAEAVDPSVPRPKAGLFADVERKKLSRGEIRGIVAREREELFTAAHEMRGFGQVAAADALSVRAAILDMYLSA